MPDLIKYSNNGVPFGYDWKNSYNSNLRPGTVHCKDAALVWFYERYLVEKIVSVFEFEGIPDNWDRDFFRYALFVCGHVDIINTRSYGIIPQCGSLGGYNIFYRPSYTMIANPLLKGSIKAVIDKDCTVIKMQPDYLGAWDIVSLYGDLFALCAEGAGISIINSKFAYVFAADNKAQAESFKKLYDNIASGQPAQFIDKDLFDQDGNPRWMLFQQNLKNTYIANDIINTMINLESQFNTLIGIPNVNINKASGVSADEVNANNVQTKALAELWLEEIKLGLEKANKMFGLDLSVRLRFKSEEVIQDGMDVDAGTV